MRLGRGIFMLCFLLFSLYFTYTFQINDHCPANDPLKGDDGEFRNDFSKKWQTTIDSEYSSNPSESAGINSSNKKQRTSGPEYSTIPSEPAGFRNDFSANNPLKRGRDGFRNDFSDAVNNKRQRLSDGEVPAGINSSAPPSASLFPFTSSPPDDITDHDFRDLVIGRSSRLLKRHTTSGPLRDLRSILCNRLSQLTRMDPTFEIGLEISDSAYLFKLLEGHDDSNLEFKNITQKAVRGAALLQEGVKLVREVQDQLKYAMKDMTCPTEFHVQHVLRYEANIII
ncbi:unnamed protein product [Ilex paraguariensis]|uniref:Uncharacterized protein n=1 Tax=Ilex paraguariensis TaxID=185542 RepID=A0ABC8UP45_9AQUA